MKQAKMEAAVEAKLYRTERETALKDLEQRVSKVPK